MAAYGRKGVRDQLLEVIWEGIYVDRTLNVNEVIEDIVSYLSTQEAKQILRTYKMADLNITKHTECK